MARWKLKQPSKRDLLIATNFYAAAADKPQQPVPKKREVRRPVDGKPVCASEHQEQSAVIAWWRLNHKRYELPEFALFAIPNGGARDIITGARLKAEGVRRGTPDLFLAAGRTYRGLFIEMKALDGTPSDVQKEFGDYLTQAVYRFRFCYGATEAIKEIEEYLA